MGMWDRLLSIVAQRLTQPSREDLSSSSYYWSPRSDAGSYVTEDSTLNIATAWACGTLIARSIAMLPAAVMAPRGTDAADGNQHLVDHPVEVLLQREPNTDMAAFQLREALLMQAVFLGNGYAEIERDQIGRPAALWPIHPERVCAMRDGNELYYEVNNGAGPKSEIAAADMFHLRGPSLDGTVGMSLISYAKNTLGLALAQEQFAGRFIRNQAAPSGVLKVKSNITDTALARQRKEVDALYSGPRNAGRVAILDLGSEWQQVGVSPQDAEFLAQRRFGVEEICRWFGVPPQKIGDTSKQTFANFEQANLSFLTDAVLPWIVRFEQETNRKLLPRTAGNRARPFLKLNFNAIVRADINARVRSYALARQWGWLSVNDIRRLEDMEPIGAEGDVYLQPMNMAPLGEDDTGDNGDDQQRQDQHRAALRAVK